MLDSVDLCRLEEMRQAVSTKEIALESEFVGGGVMSYAGPGSWANQACALGLDGPVTDEDLDRLVEFYVARGVEPRIEVAALADETLVRGLEARGFVLREFENVLAREITANEDFRAQHPHGFPKEVVIERIAVDDEAQVDAHVRTSLSGFVDGEPPPALLQTGRNAALHPRSRPFNARIGGDVVAAGAMEVSGEISALFGVTVRPEARRRGIQLAMILERLALAAREGARFAVIHSRPGIPTERNAARVGFGLVYAKVAMAMPREGLARST